MDFLEDQEISLGIAAPISHHDVVANPPQSVVLATPQSSRLPFEKVGKRTPVNHHRLSERMHRGRLVKKVNSVITNTRKAVNVFVKENKNRRTNARVEILAARHQRSGRKLVGELRLVGKKSSRKGIFGAPRVLSNHMILEVAKSRSRNKQTLANILHVDAHTITRSNNSVALCSLTLSDILGLWILQSLEALPESKRPTFCVSHTRWDETGQKIQVPIVREAAANASAWTVFVCRIRLLWGWISEDGAASGVSYFDFMLPPLFLLSTSAADLYNALEWHPRLLSARTTCRGLLMISEYKFDFREPDGATSNDKYEAFIIDIRRRWPSFTDSFICSNHGNNNGQNIVVYQAGLYNNREINVHNDAYCIALFLRMGGHFMRLFAAAPTMLRRRALVLDFPTPEADLYGEQVKDFLICSHRREHNPSDAALKTYSAHVADFVSVFGNLCGEQITLYLRGRPLTTVLKLAVDSINTVFLAHLPPVPSSGKWTKRSPCFKFIWQAGMNNLLLELAEVAFQGLKVEAETDALLRGEEETGVEADLLQELKWRQVAGGRCLKLFRTLQDEDEMFVIAVERVVNEPTDLLTYHFLWMSNNLMSFDTYSPVMDILWERTSVLNHVLQYYSTLLDGSSERLRSNKTRVNSSIGCYPAPL
jgi:hypothetical protein